MGISFLYGSSFIDSFSHFNIELRLAIVARIGFDFTPNSSYTHSGETHSKSAPQAFLIFYRFKFIVPPQNRLMPYKSVCSKMSMVFWLFTNFTCGNWLAIESLHRLTYVAVICPSTWKLPRKLRNFSTMKAFIRPPFNQNSLSWKDFINCLVSWPGLLSTMQHFWPATFSSTDGISTSLNASGSQDCCALDCPTTDEGCIKATCCQNNNKVISIRPIR